MRKFYSFCLQIIALSLLSSVCFSQSLNKSGLQPRLQNSEKINKNIKAKTKAYCYVAYDPSGKLPLGPAYTFLERPDSIVSIANHSAANFVIGGTWGGADKWYGAVYSDNTLITLDTTTGVRTIIGKMSVGLTGLTYDYTTGTLYGMSYDGASYSYLYKINQTDALATLIGKSAKGLLINIACDTSGNLYSSSISNDTLYSINKITGAGTPIGNIGFHASYAQSMEFNRSTDTLFMAAYNSTDTSGELRTVDLTTGKTKLIGKFTGKAEITALAIPYHYKSKIYDVSVSSIDMHPIVGPLKIAPKATVSNLGKNATFNVTMKISNGYTSTKTITNLATYDNLQITFDSLTPAIGNYTITVYSELDGDINSSNDTLKKALSVQKLIKAYCYVAYDPSGTLPAGTAYTYLQTPDQIFSLQDQSTSQFITSGTWGGMNKWYATVYNDNNLITIDTITGARTIIGKTQPGINGISYDYTTSTLFALGYNGGSSSLYKIDQMTGTASLIGPSVNGMLINLACDSSGRLYSLSLNNDTLYSINKITGAGTPIGNIGFVAAYAQDMEFDRYTNTLWMAAYNNTTSSGEMRTVDINTGASTLVGPFENGSEITGLAIPSNANIPANDVGVTSVISPASGCGLSDETLKVIVENLGTAAASNIPVHFSLDGGTPVNDIIAGPIPAGTNITYSFDTKINISALGNHSIIAYTSLTGDKISANDTTKYVVNHIQTSNVPYSMNFEPNESLEGWSIVDANNDGVTWGVGKDSLHSHSGKYCAELFSNPFSQTDNDWLISKCIQLDSGRTYQLSYWYRALDTAYPERMSTYLLFAPIKTSIVKMLNDLHKIINVPYQISVTNFTVSASDIYYITWHCYSVSGLALYLDDIKITDVTGINQLSISNEQLSIYPNPAKSSINVSSSESMKNIKMLNLFGQLITDKIINANNTTINTSNVDNGIYFLKIETQKGITTRKVIISK